MTGSLGIETKSASGGVHADRRARHVSRWAIRDAITTLLPGSRPDGCGRLAVPDRVPSLRVAQGKAYMAGVRRCGSVWLCPYCAAKVARARALELRQLVERAQAEGYVVTLATFTLSHDADDGLPELLKVLGDGLRRWRGGRVWQRYADTLGYVGSVRNLECTWGPSTGWHPHSHALLITRERICSSGYDWLLASRWSEVVARLGGYASLEHGLVFSDDARDVAGYVAKTEREVEEAEKYGSSWGAPEELAFAHLKVTRSSRRYNAWSLVAGFRATGDVELGDRFVEYAAAFHGKRQMYWSRGLRELFGLGDEASDQELAEASGEGEVTVATFTGQGLRQLVDSGRLGELLDVAETRGVEAAWLWLAEFFGTADYAASFDPEWWEPDSGWLSG